MPKGDNTRVLTAGDRANICAMLRDRIGMERRILEIEAEMIHLEEERRLLFQQKGQITNQAIADKFEVVPSVISKLAHHRYG